MKIEDLSKVIDNRIKSKKKDSYTNKLLKLGPKKIAQKFSEESSELLIDFKASNFFRELITENGEPF